MQRRSFVQASLGALALLPARTLLAKTSAAPSPTPDLAARTLAGSEIVLPGSDVAELAARVRGGVLTPGVEGYEAARKVWNGAFDKRPALIARCTGAADVMASVDFARAHGLITAVRAGGHSSSGKSTCNGGLMIDLTPMQGVTVDPRTRTARVASGTLLGQLDHETAAFGLVTTAGTVSDTGAAGLTLGGGLGRLARRYGLACDNLYAADVVTADGRLVRATEKENADLFWGLRGGGGNFGVVTSLEYRLHPMNPIVYGGVLQWPIAQGREVMRFHADFSRSAPDSLSVDIVAYRAPDAEPAVLADVCWCADHTQGEAALRPLRAQGSPTVDALGPVPYLKLQQSTDGFFPYGIPRYIKSGFTREISPQLIDTMLDIVNRTPFPVSIILAHGGGAVGRVAANATAFPNRDSRYWLIAIANWRDPAQTAARVAAMRTLWQELEPFTYGYYVNAITEDEESKERELYGNNYARMVTLKKKYDPNNLFRLNANVKPG